MLVRCQDPSVFCIIGVTLDYMITVSFHCSHSMPTTVFEIYMAISCKIWGRKSKKGGYSRRQIYFSSQSTLYARQKVNRTDLSMCLNNSSL